MTPVIAPAIIVDVFGPAGVSCWEEKTGMDVAIAVVVDADFDVVVFTVMLLLGGAT
jgi:hypothetical protein